MTKNDVGRQPEIHFGRKLRKANIFVYTAKTIRRMVVWSQRIYILFMISKPLQDILLYRFRNLELENWDLGLMLLNINSVSSLANVEI